MHKQFIYFVRHGETVLNIKHKIQGTIDSPLTKKGVIQATKLHNYFLENHIIFDHAYASTLQRTVVTLRLITDIAYEQMHDLDERNFGSFEGKETQLVPALPFGNYFLPFGGETDEEVCQRMNHALKEIVNRPQSKIILVVSHGACLRTLMASWSGKVEDKDMILPNCGIAKYAYFEEKFHLIKRITTPLDE